MSGTTAEQPAASAADDDIFGAALTVEHDAVATGRREGKRDGMKQGYYEGREMGMKKGAELGRELAFYTACAHTWTALAQAQPQHALSSKSAHRPAQSTSAVSAALCQCHSRTGCFSLPLSMPSIRATASLHRLSTLLSSPSLASPLHPSFFDSLQTVRTRYKQLLIHMHVQHCMRRQSNELGDNEQDDDAEGENDDTREVGRRSQDMRRIAQAAELSF